MSTCPRSQPEMNGDEKRKKKSNKGPKVTNQMVEDELDHMAQCFENKRQLRLAKIPEDIAQCIQVNRCCKPRPTCVDFFYDRFVRELNEDDKIRRQIKTQSACTVSKDFEKFTPRLPSSRTCPLPCACNSVICCPPPTPCRAPSPSKRQRGPCPKSGQGVRKNPSTGTNTKLSAHNTNRKPLTPKSSWAGPRKTTPIFPNSQSSPTNMYRQSQLQHCPSQAKSNMQCKISSMGPCGAAGMGPSQSSGYQRALRGKGAEPSPYQGTNRQNSSVSTDEEEWGKVPPKRVINEENCMNYFPCK